MEFLSNLPPWVAILGYVLWGISEGLGESSLKSNSLVGIFRTAMGFVKDNILKVLKLK